MQTITITGNTRTATGKKATKINRREGLIPCVLYGGEQNHHFTTSISGVRGLVYTPNFYKISLELEGKSYDAILKDIQFAPVTDQIEHIDFQQLVAGNKVLCDIPIRTTGVSTGVREGGKLLINVRKLRVKTTPEDLTDAIEVDVSHLGLGHSFRVRDIKGTKMEILNSASIPLVTVEIPRSLRSATAQKEVPGKKK